MVGPEIMQPPMHYCGTVAVAPLSLTRSGSYAADVLHLNTGFSYEAPSPLNERVHVGSFSFEVCSICM